MTRYLTTVLCVLVLCVPVAGAPLAAQTSAAPEVPVVVTTGEGVVMTAPDRAFLNVTAESRASNPREAQRKNADIMKPVQDKLKALGVMPDAVRTTVVDLRMEYDYANGRQVARGYVAVNSVEVRIDNLDRVGEVLDAVVTAGATSVSDIRFDAKDRAKLEREAVTRAVQDARSRAEAAVAGAGRTIERILRIEEHGVAVPQPVPMRAMLMKDAGQAADTPIATGQIEFRARVTLTAVMK